MSNIIIIKIINHVKLYKTIIIALQIAGQRFFMADFKRPKVSGKLVFTVLLMMVVLGVFLSCFWHSLSPNNYPFADAKLTYFDSNVSALQQVCFGLQITPHFMESMRLETIKVETNKRIVFEQEVELKTKKEDFFSFQHAIQRSGFSGSQFESDSKNLDICINPEFLEAGKNLINIYSGENHLFFHAIKTDNRMPETNAAVSAVAGLESKNGQVVFFIENNSKGGTYPLTIMSPTGTQGQDEGKAIASYLIDVTPYEKKEIEIPLKELQNITHQASAGTPAQALSIGFKGSKANFVLQETQAQRPSVLPGAIFLVFALIASFALFGDLCKTERTTNALALVVCIFMVVPWALDLFEVPLNQLTVILGITLSFAIVFALKHYFFRTKPAKNKSEKDQALLFALIPLAGVILFSFVFFFMPSHFNDWNVFYERYAQAITENNMIPVSDTLSYLGRGFTFVWGYFLLNSSIHFVSGAQANALFYLVWIFSNTLFAYSAVNLARAIKLSEKQQLLFYALFMSSLFVFVSWAVSPKHVLAFSLAVIAATRMIKGKNIWITAAIGAMAAFTQFSMIVFAPAMCVILSKKVSVKKTALTLAAMFLLFSLLYMPILLSWGMPYEVEPQKWGYMINHSFFDLLPDLGGLVFFFLAAGLISAAWQWKKLDRYVQKLAVSGAILVIIQLFVSYRVNLLTHMTLAVLALNVFSKQLSEKNFFNLIVLVVGISLFLNFSILSSSTTPLEYPAAMHYLKTHSLPDENTAVSPLHAHVATYLGQRKALSDLYVEYADMQKLSDTYSLIIDEDEQIVRKYGIKYIIIDPQKVFMDATKPTFFSKEKEFDFMDKVYSNHKMTIHRQPEI